MTHEDIAAYDSYTYLAELLHKSEIGFILCWYSRFSGLALYFHLLGPPAFEEPLIQTSLFCLETVLCVMVVISLIFRELVSTSLMSTTWTLTSCVPPNLYPLYSASKTFIRHNSRVRSLHDFARSFGFSCPLGPNSLLSAVIRPAHPLWWPSLLPSLGGSRKSL